MRLPHSYRLSLQAWARLQGNKFPVSSTLAKIVQDNDIRSASPSAATTKFKRGSAEMPTLPAWVPSFVVDFLGSGARNNAATDSGAAGPDGPDPGAPANAAGKGAVAKDATAEESPFAQMTVETFADLFPEHALNSLDRPTFWPHTSDEQLTAEDELRQKNQNPHD